LELKKPSYGTANLQRKAALRTHHREIMSLKIALLTLGSKFIYLKCWERMPEGSGAVEQNSNAIGTASDCFPKLPAKPK